MTKHKSHVSNARGVIAFRVLLTPDWVLLTTDFRMMIATGALLTPENRVLIAREILLRLTAPVYQINSFNAIQVTRAFVQGK